MDAEKSMWLMRRRIEKHAVALDEWKTQLTRIREECEQEIGKTCRVAAEQFVTSRQVADQIMANFIQQEGKQPPFACLEEGRIKIEQFANNRENNINWLHRNLKETESRRLDMIKTAIQQLKVKLPSCSHMPPIQVQNFICNEASQINHMLALNHRRIVQLVGNLKMETAVATYRLHSEWEEYYKTWQQSNTTKLIDQFKDSAQKLIDECPVTIKALLSQLSEDFTSILMRRDQILQDFRMNFRLFAEAPEKTEACLRDLQDLQRLLVRIFPNYLEKIFKAFEEVLDNIRQELQVLKETLLHEKFVKDEECLDPLVNELSQTVIGQLKTKAEGSLAYLEISFNWIVATNQKHFLDPIVQFITELTQNWRASSFEGLRLQQIAYREELNTKRAANREQIDEQEIRLGQVIDDLRRADNEDVVEERLEEALGMLQDIQTLREQQHQSVLDFLKQYPARVAKTLLQFQRDVCQFFGVHRCVQAEVPTKLQKDLEILPPIFDKYLGSSEPKTPKRRYAMQEVRKFTLTPTAIFYAMSEEEIRREIYARERKTYTSGFQRLNSPDSTGKKELPLGVLSVGLPADFDDMPRLAWLLPTSKKKLQSPSTDDTAPLPMVCSFPTSEDQMYSETLREFPIIEPTVLHKFIRQFKRNVREECLIVLDQWMMDCMKEAEERVVQEVSDENAAYILQSMILGPREARIREDVADVRKFELEEHRNRMLRHRIAIEEAIEEDKQKLPSLKTILVSLEDKIRHIFQKETVSLSSHSNTEILQRLQAQMNQIAIAHMNEVRKTLCNFREAYEKRTHFLRNSNADFLKACRLFSEDGNFSPGECHMFSEELQQLSDKITQEEAEVLGHLERGEREQKELIEQLLHNFSDIYRVHLTDLIYLEGMARCLRRAQTQIKSEIADSTSQSRKLQEHLNAMEESMRDLGQLPAFLPSERNEPLNSILQAYSELVMGASHRCVYLGCLKMQPSGSTVAGIGIPTDHPTRVLKQVKALTWAATSEGAATQTHLEKLAKEVRANVSRAGRPAHDDSSVKLLQALLRQPKTQDQASPVVNSSQQQNVATDEQGKGTGERTSRSSQGKKNQARAIQKRKSSNESRISVATERSSKSNVEGTARLKKLIALQIRQNVKYNVFGVLSGDAFKDSNPKLPPQKPERTVAEKASEEGAESSSFVGRVRKICRDSLEAGLLLVEKYYSVKGNSPNTRPKLIHKNPDLAADALLTKLQSYFNQSKCFLKKSTSEFREQMSRLEVACSRLAKVFFNVLCGRLQKKCEAALEAIDAESSVQLKQLDLQREQNYSQLHTKLGFPQYVSTEFSNLHSMEERRRQDTEELLLSILKRKVDVLQNACHDFAKKAPVLLESLLLRFDSLVCSNEIQDDDEQSNASNQTIDRYRGKQTLPVIDWTEFSNGLRVPSRLQIIAQAPGPALPMVMWGAITNPATSRTDASRKFLHYLQTEIHNAEMACEDAFRFNERWSKEWEMNRQLILDLSPLRKNQNIPKTP